MVVSNEIGDKIIEAMPRPDRIRYLLKAAGFDRITDFAAREFDPPKHPQEISYCITGEREYPEIRNRLAVVLDLRRTEVDLMIDGPAEGAA